jgi:hypothetical protein
MRAGNRLEFEDALELALEGPIVLKGSTVDNLHRAKRAGDAACEPNFAVRPATDAPEQVVVRNAR